MGKYKEAYTFSEKLIISKQLPKFPLKAKNWQVNVKNKNCLVIECNSIETAHKAVNLIYASSALSHGCIYFDKEMALKKFEKKIDTTNFSQDGLIHHACLISTKASSKLNYIYAIFKLYKSYELVSIPAIDLIPFEKIKKPSINKPLIPNLQVALAFSIIAAYSAIEELGISPPKKEKINNKDKEGNWNPELKEIFELNLKKKGIDPSSSILWTLRGKKSYIEKKRSTKIIKKAPWSLGLIRDEEISLIDAIADASWLRSWVSAHVLSSKENLNRIKTLSIYDATNVQNLARLLILESLNLLGIFRENNFTKKTKNKRKK